LPEDTGRRPSDNPGAVPTRAILKRARQHIPYFLLAHAVTSHVRLA